MTSREKDLYKCTLLCTYGRENLHDHIEQLFGWDIFGKKTSLSQSIDNNC